LRWHRDLVRRRWTYPVGARHSVSSCNLRILVDQSTESIPSLNPSRRQDDRWVDGPERWGLPQGAGWAVHVVMVGEPGQHRYQLPTSEDEHPIEQLASDAADPSLRVSVRPRRPHRRAQHPDPLGSKDRLERDGDLRCG
jgi:hypothetical protein